MAQNKYLGGKASYIRPAPTRPITPNAQQQSPKPAEVPAPPVEPVIVPEQPDAQIEEDDGLPSLMDETEMETEGPEPDDPGPAGEEGEPGIGKQNIEVPLTKRPDVLEEVCAPPIELYPIAQPLTIPVGVAGCPVGPTGDKGTYPMKLKSQFSDVTLHGVKYKAGVPYRSDSIPDAFRVKYFEPSR